MHDSDISSPTQFKNGMLIRPAGNAGTIPLNRTTRQRFQKGITICSNQGYAHSLILNEYLDTRILRWMNTAIRSYEFSKHRLVLQKVYVQANTHCNGTVVRFFSESHTLAELLAFHLMTEARMQSSIDEFPKPRADSH